MNDGQLERRQFCQILGLGLIAATTPMECALPPPPQSAPSDDGRPVAQGRIAVKPEAGAGEVSPYIFGSSVEWTGDGNGLFDPGRGALRSDVMELLRPLRIPVWRFPGGILADYYHWRDGVGPQAGRPKRLNPMDNSENANTFGTDEFISFVRTVGGEPLLTANVGTGTYEELDEWRRHFESAGMPVKLWELGNEIYLAEPKARATIPGNDQRIYRTSSAYATLAADWAKRLHSAQPGVMVGGIAGTANTSRENRDWLPVLLSSAASGLDFVALHNAFAPLIFGSYDYSNEGRRLAAYRAMSGQVLSSAADDADVMSRWRAARAGQPARIAITEHFPLFGGGGDVLPILDQSRTMAAALFTAGLFHAWMRTGVWLATYNLSVSPWFGALVTQTKEGLVRTPTYYTFDLYRNRFGRRLVEASAAGPTFSAPAVGTVTAHDSVPYLDVAAALDDGERLTLSVICRRFAGKVDAAIEGMPAATVEVTTLAAPVPNAINGSGLTSTTRPNSMIEPHTSTWTYKSGDVYSFPENSITVLRWPKI